MEILLCFLCLLLLNFFWEGILGVAGASRIGARSSLRADASARQGE